MRLEILTALYPQVDWLQKCREINCNQCWIKKEHHLYNINERYHCYRFCQGKFPFIEYWKVVVSMIQEVEGRRLKTVSDGNSVRVENKQEAIEARRPIIDAFFGKKQIMNIEKIKAEIIRTTKKHLVNRLYEGLCVDEKLLNEEGIILLVEDCINFYAGKNDHLKDRLELVPPSLRREFKHTIRLALSILETVDKI